MVQNKKLIYKSIPDGWPVSGKDLVIEKDDFDTDAPAPPGGITTKNIYVAFDPSQRGRMREMGTKSYSPPMPINKPLQSVTVAGKVLKSASDKCKEDDLVLIVLGGTEEYSRIPAEHMGFVEVVKPAEGVPLTAYLGVLGMTGMTAYGALREIGQPKKGQTIVISGAAGAVGQVVGQIAVREGLTVIGSVGEDRKLEFITKTLGFHSGWNYKKEDAGSALARLAPKGIDIYWDNVGGEQTDAAINALNDYGRLIACGGISQYNKKPSEQYGMKNTLQVVRKRIRWQGFIVTDPSIAQHKQARNENITKWLQEGSFHSIDHFTEGIDNAAAGFLGMLKGENLGKSILKLCDE